MKTITKMMKHLMKVIRHKHWVWTYCVLAGYPKRGLLHDMSKFSWTELKESIEYYQGNKSPIPVARKSKGYSAAFLHHKGRNPHHPEFWADFIEGKLVWIPMPFKYIVEMIADWYAAGKAYHPHQMRVVCDEYDWWLRNKSRIGKVLHPTTFRLVTEIMNDTHLLEDPCDVFNYIRTHRDHYEDLYSKMLFAHHLTKNDNLTIY